MSLSAATVAPSTPSSSASSPELGASAFTLGTPALGPAAGASALALVKALGASGAEGGGGGGGGGGSSIPRSGSGSGSGSRRGVAPAVDPASASIVYVPAPAPFSLPAPLSSPSLAPASASSATVPPSPSMRSPRFSALNLPSFLAPSSSAGSLAGAEGGGGGGGASAGAVAAGGRGSLRDSPSSAVLGAPMKVPVPRVDSDDQLYQQAVSWEVDPAEIDFGRSSKIGQGGHGEVYRAKWRGTPIAVKQLAASGGVALAEMRHEIAVLAHMHHPRVVQFLGACTKGRPVLVLSEYLRGGSVAQALEQLRAQGERLPRAVAGRWALDMAQGLRYLHEHKPMPVVHRDLKPQNLLIDGSGHAKISDFGLAKVVDQLKQLDEHYVMTGETGSYRYMAPEVFRHERYNDKVDIFAFGMILFQLTSPVPEPPFSWLGAVAAAEAISLRHERPEISPKLDARLRALINTCWHPDPAQRPTAAHCCGEVEACFPAPSGGLGAAGAADNDGYGIAGLMSAEAALASEERAWRAAGGVGVGAAAASTGHRQCALV